MDWYTFLLILFNVASWGLVVFYRVDAHRAKKRRNDRIEADKIESGIVSANELRRTIGLWERKTKVFRVERNELLNYDGPLDKMSVYIHNKYFKPWMEELEAGGCEIQQDSMTVYTQYNLDFDRHEFSVEVYVREKRSK